MCKYQNITSILLLTIAFVFTVTLWLFYLFDWKFVNQMNFYFLQGKMCAPERADRHRAHNLSRPGLPERQFS